MAYKSIPWNKCRGLMTVLLTLTFLFAFAGNLAARTVTGNVSDSSGEPLVGATVKLVGTNNAVMVDVDGNFSINVLQKGKLEVSYIGYETIVKTLNESSVYNFVLQENAEILDEVVVLGYNTVSKKSFTGSAATVKSDEITAIKTVSPTEALQGRVSGVSVVSSSGVPGASTSIKIRGVNSINSGKEPLWIIDGVPMYSGGGLEASNSTTSQDPMSMINPNDIESMEILKDAAATAIYGSRGTNGVIIITTKSGRNKESGNVTIDVSYGISELSRTPEDIGFADTEQWFRIADMAYQHSTGIPDAVYEPAYSLSAAAVPFSPITREEALATNSNWTDQALRTGHFIDINLGLTRGFEKGSVFTSLNYRSDTGVLRNNDFKKFSGRINADYEVIRNLQVGMNMSFSYSMNNRVKNGSAGSLGGGGGTAGSFQALNRSALPWLPIYDEDSNTGYWSARSGNMAANNDRRFLRDYVKQYRVIGNAFAEFKIAAVKGLAVRAEIGVDYINNSSVDWRHAEITEDAKSFAYDQNASRFVLNSKALVKYNNRIGDHNIAAVAGVEGMQMESWLRTMRGYGLVGVFPELGSTNPGDMSIMRSYFNNEDYLLSYFLRADYLFKDRYALAISARTDGSSKFDKKKRWGKFLAGSIGWVISDESFFEDARHIMNNLKIKAGYGQTGNNSVPNGIYEMNWSTAAGNRYGIMDVISSGTMLNSIPNRSATWETTNNFDFGIDYGFLQNRISGSIDFYYKKITDMLLKASLPISSGINGGNSIWSNIGDMSNYGVDISVRSTNIRTKDFTWTTNFNISFNRNKVLALTPELDKGGKGMSGGNLTQIVKGHRYGTYFMPDYAGIDPEKGVEMIWEIDRSIYDETGETVKTGKKIPATKENLSQNNYLFEDKTSLPTFYGGLNNTFNYKGFDLNIFFTFSGGNYIYDANLARASSFFNGQAVILADLNESNIWSPENPNAKYPIQSFNGNYPGAAWDNTIGDWNPDPTVSGSYSPNYNHSKHLYKGDYLRLKSLSLGYTFPTNWTKKAFIENLRIYVQATNLWTVTDYPGYDPEGASYVFNPSLPNLKTYSVGLSAKF